LLFEKQRQHVARRTTTLAQTMLSVARSFTSAIPMGRADYTLAGSTTNPVTVRFATCNLPLDNTMCPDVGPMQVPAGNAPTATPQQATASIEVTLPPVYSVLLPVANHTLSNTDVAHLRTLCP